MRLRARISEFKCKPALSVINQWFLPVGAEFPGGGRLEVEPGVTVRKQALCDVKHVLRLFLCTIDFSYMWYKIEIYLKALLNQ